ncbi:spatacsin [Drosophila nasuta]|uniref:spatacsin n=1 Tax=Drosophila nasuta TaxID=42062 RepID=UPI00295F1910|nr:spatacsin [Drosophila nasuta]
MHSTQARNKIFKSWSGISEVSIIKEVATKGEHIDLCMEYWAAKQKIPVSEYRHYFYDVVDAYVRRLLSERLVCKADNVLHNVERDVKCFFYQYACECNDADLSEFVLDHLRCRDPQLFEQEQTVLEYYWSLVKQLRDCSDLLNKHKSTLPRVHIEALMTLPEHTLQLLLVELYFANHNDELLSELNKQLVWQHLVNTAQLDRLRRWCWCQDADDTVELKPLEQAYAVWRLEPAMYEYALEHLEQPCEPLRNYFAQAGYFFAAEAADVSTVLRRLCTMQCLDQHKELICRLPMARHLLERGYHSLLLLDCVPVSALEQLAGENEPLLTLLIELKTHDPTEREGFELLSKSVQSYLERTHNAAESLQEQPLLTFFDFLCHEPSVLGLEGFLSSSNLSRVPYLKSLMSRFERHVPGNAAAVLPSPHDLFNKFKHVNLDALAAAHPGELISFSNARLSQRYARKAQLNYTHYLKQQRSAYAVYYFLMEQLQLYGQITRTQLFHACETATQLALQHAGDEELVTHCVACCEMLDFDTQTLRSFLHLQRRLPATSTASSYTEQLQHWDRALVHELQQQSAEFPLESYTALMRLAARNLQGKWPTAMLQHFAASNEWWQLLLLFQYFDLPLSELQQLLPHFKCRALGVHMLRALSYDCSHERQHKRAANRQTRRGDGQTNSSQDNMTNSSHSSGLDANLQQLQRDSGQSMCSLLTHNAQQDVFAIVLCSSNNLPDECIGSTAKFVELMQSSGQHCTSINLLKHCVRHQMPILAVLAATLSDQNRDWCWLVWLAVASGQWTQLLLEASRSREQEQEEYVWSLIRNVVKEGQVNALLHSFCIFQPDCKFVHLCRFLQLTAQHQDFSDSTIVELRHFLCSWSQDAVQLPLCAPLARKQLMQRCIGLLLLQLQCNFDCSMQQQKFLECICRSDVGDICDLLDFCLLHRIFGVAATWIRQLGIDYELLVRRDSAEYKRLVDALTEAKAYEEALQLAALLQLPLADIVYAKWLAELEAGQLHQHAEYEREIEQHALPPAILVNFLLQAAAQQPEENLRRRYELLQSALGVIKQHHLFPNESFDRDQIEYDMVMCYVQLELEQETEPVTIYHSEYFEQIMRQERCVLYKSFSELKELAGIDDLSIANKSQLTPEMEQRLDGLLQLLLDEGDIVEALRLQELFEFRPNDLRFIVFAMALAEGMTSIVNLSSKERQLLSDIEKSTFPKFNRLTLNQNPLGRCSSDLSASCSTLEFEEIPSKEKQQTLDTLLGIGSKLKHGVELGRRIVLAYRAAMYLDKEYLDVLRTKDASVLLRSAAEEDCLQRLLVVSDIYISTRLTPKEIADSLALELTTCIVRPRFYIFHASQQPRNAPRNADLWGHSIDKDFHLFLELTPNTTMLGNCLLEYCDALKAYRRYQDKKPFEPSDAFERLSGIITLYGLPNVANSSSSNAPGSPAIPQVLSHKKQNQIYVELLIKANLCFVHECSMEGIASVLERAKHLNGQLAKAKSWSLIVRLLIGIARYREMFYCFDSLIENEQFESLLGQFDDDQKSGLRQAILAYLREYNPKNGKELLRLAAHHFLMYKELAEMWSGEAQDVLATISSAAADQGRLRCSQGLQQLLQQALENYTHATENYLLDNKLILAQQSVARAELMAMQLDLCNKALEKRGGSSSGSNQAVPFCVSVIGVQTREQFRELVNQQLSVPQTLILSRAYGYDVNWSDALLTQFVVLQRRNYLQEYLCHQRINDNVIEQVAKGYILYTQHNAPTGQQQESLGQLVEHIRSVTLKYKLASILGLKLIVMSLINEQTVHYLRDTNYGRNEPHNVANM